MMKNDDLEISGESLIKFIYNTTVILAMDRDTALQRLRKERDYEDALVKRLNQHIINRLNEIKDITEHEREVLKKELGIIANDSSRHEFLFSGLMQQVLEEDERVKY